MLCAGTLLTLAVIAPTPALAKTDVVSTSGVMRCEGIYSSYYAALDSVDITWRWNASDGGESKGAKGSLQLTATTKDDGKAVVLDSWTSQIQDVERVDSDTVMFTSTSPISLLNPGLSTGVYIVTDNGKTGDTFGQGCSDLSHTEPGSEFHMIDAVGHIRIW